MYSQVFYCGCHEFLTEYEGVRKYVKSERKNLILDIVGFLKGISIQQMSTQHLTNVSATRLSQFLSKCPRGFVNLEN